MSDEQTASLDSDATRSTQAEGTLTKWWVVSDDQPDGPHSAAYIAMMLGEGRLKPSTKVCRVGQTEWRALMDVPELVAVVETQSPGSLPPTMPSPSGACQSIRGFFARFSNPALPRFANWLCVYCILFTPAFMAIGFLFTIGGGLSTAADLKHDSPLVGYAVAYDVLTFVVDISLAIVMVAGGLLLRRLQSKGAMLIKVGLVLQFCWLVVVLLVMILWGALVTLGEQAQPTSEEFTAGDGFMFLLFLAFMLLALASVIFEVVALVWLIRKDHLLPLVSSTPVESVAEVKP